MPYVGQKPADIISTAVDTVTGKFSGEIDAASLDISGNIDVDGITNLDVTDIDGTLNVAGETTLQTHLNMGDNDTIKLGAGVDLTLASNGTHGTIATPNGILTVDAASTLILDSDAGNIQLKDGGNNFMTLSQTSSTVASINIPTSDGDLHIVGNDGGAAVTALSFDMSATGNATFSGQVIIPQYLTHAGDGNTFLEFGTDTIDLYAGNVRGVTLSTGAVVINEGSADVDFRVETGGNANTLVCDGGNNTVSVGGTNVTARFNIVGVGGSAAQIQNNIAAGTGAVVQIGFLNANGLVGSIQSSGSATAYVTSSDYRLKENVSYSFDATTRLKQLKPARFNFKADEDNTLVDGFIAHEVSSIVPEAVTGEKDATNEDGSVNPQGIDQSKLVPLLVKTIQELEARITTLENA